ncbi:M1 family metallopeptidase [uncultured Mucilaginibacter sp.]|uniref:M1 family metallopeptidase n=1 Tax=uncultured Mucilaginibacter sp. TaxID=797541 RepID=UPI00261C06A5|nr:M1 family metallopeptidase [uncultured Mucilaginibacter sp.]
MKFNGQYKIISSVSLLLIFVCCTKSFGQNLPMPPDIQKAFQKGTHLTNGKPGKNYWQNTGNYNISITANPPGRDIRGTEDITYFNNSPDTLKQLVMRLVQNIHKRGARRNPNSQADTLSNGIVIDQFKVNGKTKPLPDNEGHYTWQNVDLDKPLLPHDSIKLSVNWHFYISPQKGREGILDETTYFLAYYYPRVSVYDDYNGWDRLDFTGGREFYNDFNNYSLQVTVPKNFVVWATGTLQNPNEVLKPVYAKRLNQSMTADSVFHIATKTELLNHQVTAQNATNTWKWTATDISDMALALSDHYDWDASSTIVDEKTNRRASVQSAYNDDAADFHQMVRYGQHALNWFSKNWPGVPYPFPKTTIVQGFADMEYPMMVNDDTNRDTTFSRFVAEHEIAHTWFPFYMGINESSFGFMDEGWATTLEYLIGQVDLGKEQASENFKQFRVNRWIKNRNLKTIQVPIVTRGELTPGNILGDNEYGKPALAYLALKDMLGDVLFKKSLQEFMSRWHGKHPIPWDFFYSMSNASGKNLDWFWNNWFFSSNYIDLSIQTLNPTKKGNTLVVDNIGGFAVPFDVNVVYADGSTQTFHQTPEVWQKDEKQATILLLSAKKINSVKLDGGIFMDADTSNNTLSVK